MLCYSCSDDASNFRKPAKTKDKLAESQSTEIEVKPEIKKSELDKKSKETESKEEESKKEPETTEEQEESEEEKEGNKDNGQPVQNIQPRVTKPEEPDPEVLKNPNQKPDTVPGAAPEGESQEGKIYAPGFGWIDDIGEGEGIEDSNIYENGNKIGIMD